MGKNRFRQTGTTLIISLIMLVLLTLIGISAINSSTTNLRIAGNMQAMDEARGAAQQAIELLMSSRTNFDPSPTGAPATWYSVDNSGTNQYSVTVATPVCKAASLQIPARSPQCVTGVASPLPCWDTLWEVTATAVDPKTGVTQTVVQGTALTFDPTFDPSAC